MPELLESIGIGVSWVAVFGICLYGGYHFLMAMNAWPITGVRNMVWPPIQDIEPIELPAKYILHRNKARRALTLFFGFGAVGSIVLLANAVLRNP